MGPNEWLAELELSTMPPDAKLLGALMVEQLGDHETTWNRGQRAMKKLGPRGKGWPERCGLAVHALQRGGWLWKLSDPIPEQRIATSWALTIPGGK